MSKTVSFHKHEVVGEVKTREMLTRLGFPPSVIEDTCVLVREHQFRFYEDTKDETIQKWMRRLGRDNSFTGRWRFVMLLRLYDRAGNDMNKNKPLATKEWKDLWRKCSALEPKTVYFEDLAVSKNDLVKLKVPKNKIQEALSNMIGIVQSNGRRNTRKFLLEYIKKNYGKKK